MNDPNDTKESRTTTEAEPVAPTNSSETHTWAKRWGARLLLLFVFGYLIYRWNQQIADGEWFELSLIWLPLACGIAIVAYLLLQIYVFDE